MKVGITFDKAAVERRGYTLEAVRQTVKSLFASHDLPCVFDDDCALAFGDKGHGDDFACMWDIILALLRSDAPPVELLPPAPKGQLKKRKAPER